jgi:hypothetical protein
MIKIDRGTLIVDNFENQIQLIEERTFQLTKLTRGINDL